MSIHGNKWAMVVYDETLCPTLVHTEKISSFVVFSSSVYSGCFGHCQLSVRDNVLKLGFDVLDPNGS